MAVPPEILDLPLQHHHDVRLLPASLVAETRTVEVVWSTGAEVRRTDPWTGKPYHEVLSLEPGHVDLLRLEAGAPLLDSHAALTLAGIIGVVEWAWIDTSAAGPEGRAVICFILEKFTIIDFLENRVHRVVHVPNSLNFAPDPLDPTSTRSSVALCRMVSP